jgi:anti-sigma-K factor RskA
VREHEKYREWSAAYVLGALDSAQRHEFEAHLGGCGKCQDEVQSFAPIPGLLSRIQSPEVISVPSGIEERSVDRVRWEWTVLVRCRRRWRAVAAAAVVATILALATILSGLSPVSGTPLVFAEGAQASGEIVVEERAWGTEVALDLKELPPADSYEAWAIDEEGRWHQVAAWGPTANLSASVTGASSVTVSELDRIVVTTGDREQTIVEAWLADA